MNKTCIKKLHEIILNDKDQPTLNGKIIKLKRIGRPTFIRHHPQYFESLHEELQHSIEVPKNANAYLVGEFSKLNNYPISFYRIIYV